MKAGRTILLLLLLAAVYAAGYGYGRWYAKGRGVPASGGRRILYYVDPMHPAYKSDKPGVAPDCGMKLAPVYEGEGMAMPPAQRKILYYRDPKMPSHTSDKPGLNPETGNELEPVYAPESMPSFPPGTVQISPEKQQLIGVKFGTVEYTPAAQTIRTVGKVTYDETRIARVHTKVEGWIDKVFVNFTGDIVQKGQPVLTLYSPELLATQQEFLLALKARDLMRHSTMADMPAYSESLLAAARKRLELWDLSQSQIEEISRTQQPVKNVTIYSPITGYVTTRNAFPNQKIQPDTDLYTIVDLSKVWIMADVFEYEAPQVHVGQPATLALSYYPGKKFPGRVSYIQPQVDPVTRTIKVRIALDNPGNVLKPEMFADVELRIPSPPRLTVPAEAVLDSGQVKTVFVDRGNGYLEPRHVETGERLGGRTEILKGLQAGDRVVVSGNFLVDSESQLKAAAAGMAHEH